MADVALKIGRAVGGVYNKVMNFRSLDERDERWKGLDGASGLDRSLCGRILDPSKNELRRDMLDSLEMARLPWPDGEQSIPVDETDAIDAAFERDALKLESLSLPALESAYASWQRQAPYKTPSSGARVRAHSTATRSLLPSRRLGRGFSARSLTATITYSLTRTAITFAEVHHIHPLAEGGEDTPQNVACICPSHHREAHHGKRAQIIRRALEMVRAAEIKAAAIVMNE